MPSVIATRMPMSGNEASHSREGYSHSAQYPLCGMNPSLYDEGNGEPPRFGLVRVISVDPHIPVPMHYRNQVYFTLLLNMSEDAKGAVVARLPGSEDARGILVNDVRYATFTRYHYDFDQQREWTDMNVARLYPGPVIEKKLRWSGASSREKNWSPFQHGGSVYFTQYFCPIHRVLRCELSTGHCETAYETATPTAFCNAGTLRGGSGAVRIGERFVGVLHRLHPGCGHGKYAKPETACHDGYEHAFYELQGEPPFAMQALSDWFRFPDVLDDAHRSCVTAWMISGRALNRVQFCAGISRVGEDLMLAFGAGDAEAYTVRIPVVEALQALRCSVRP